MSSSAATEAFRSLQSTIKYAKDRSFHTVLIVDVDRPTPSSVGAQLARAFVNAGDRCLYVDANLRTEPGESAGLSELLRGAEADETEIIVTDDDLERVGPGREPNPDLLAGDRLGLAIAALRENHEYIVLTCAPMPEFSDAVAIAPRVDAVVLVISAGVTDRDAAVRTRDALERVGANILGIVMVERPRRWF